jgi:nickel/cobalt exporter
LPYFASLSPCPLTTIIMVVALANGMVTLGLLVTFSMALGMIGTVSLFALAVILARRLLLDLLTRRAAHVERVARALEILGAAAVTAIGLLLFAFEFVEGNRITQSLLHEAAPTVEAVRQGHFTGKLA